MKDDTQYKLFELHKDEVPEAIKKTQDAIYRSEQKKQLKNMKGYKHLAWTPRIKHLYYNKKEDVLVKNLEANIFIWKNPSKETIEEQVQQWPKAEVSLGEKYNSRFN